jgi:PEP-CTERM motif
MQRFDPLFAEAARHVRAGLLAALLASAWLPAAAQALMIDVAFTTSTYQVQAGDTYSVLLAQHQAGSVLGAASVTTLEDVSTAVYAGGVTTDYSVLMRVVLDVEVTGLYTFQVGVDWGRGGVAAVVDNSNGQVISEYVRTDDLWWAYDWNNPTVFTNQVTLNQGESYTLDWIGFEGCCAGSSTIRFSHEGGAYQTLDAVNLAPYIAPIPEPGTAALLGLGLAVLAARRPGSDRR